MESIKEIKLFEVFAGIGSQRIALNNIAKNKKWTINSMGIIEWYLDAIIAYEIIHNNKVKINDHQLLKITKTLSKDSKNPLRHIDKFNFRRQAGFINNSAKYSNNLFNIAEITGKNIPKNIDIFTYSFPCQDLSIQGKQKGMKKSSKTRSGLVWEVLRILQEMKNKYKNSEMPKYLILENVKSILNANHFPQFKKFIKKINELGYHTTYDLLDATNFGSCQKRERLFAVSTRNDLDIFNFANLVKKNIKKQISSILNKNIIENKAINKIQNLEYSKWKTSKHNIISANLKNYSSFHSESIIYKANGFGPTLTASGANSRIKIVDKNNQIWILSAQECYRYMGFKNYIYNRLKKENLLNENKLIYLAGNSISIELLEAIFSQLKF